MYACMPAALVGSAAAAISARRRSARPVTSGRWNEPGASEGATLEVDDPCRTFLEPALARFDDLALDELFDQLPDDVSVRAEHHLVQLGIADELHRAGQPMALGQRWRLLHRQLAGAGQRFDRLHAAQKRTRVNRRDRKRLQDLDERLGLLDSLPGQRALAIVTGPVAPAARLRMPHDIKSSHPLC